MYICLSWRPETPQGDQQNVDDTDKTSTLIQGSGSCRGVTKCYIPCGIVRTKQDTFSNLLFGIATFGDTHRQPSGLHGIIICVSIHLIRHRKPIEVALSIFRYNHIKTKIKSLISLLIALYTHNIQTFYLFPIGTEVTLFSKKANWHRIRIEWVKVIYVCMCPDLPLYK